MSNFTFSIINSVILCSILVLFQTTLAVSLTKKLFCRHNKRLSQSTLIKKSLQFYAIIGYTLITLAGISCIIIRIHHIDNQSAANVYVTCRSLYQLFILFAMIAGYFFLICRLFAVFEDSIYKVKSSIIYVHIGIIIFTVFVILLLIWMARYNVYNPEILNLFFGSIFLLPFGSMIHLIFSFNYRLFKLVLLTANTTRTASTSYDIEGSDNTSTFDLGRKQIDMLSVVRRQTLLGVLIIFIAFVAMIDYIIGVVVYSMSDIDGRYIVLLSMYPDSAAYIVIFDIINVLCFNMASLCFYLGYTFNKQYYICLCSCCDAKCKILCETLARKRITATR